MLRRGFENDTSLQFGGLKLRPAQGSAGASAAASSCAQFVTSAESTCGRQLAGPKPLPNGARRFKCGRPLATGRQVVARSGRLSRCSAGAAASHLLSRSGSARREMKSKQADYVNSGQSCPARRQHSASREPFRAAREPVALRSAGTTCCRHTRRLISSPRRALSPDPKPEL